MNLSWYGALKGWEKEHLCGLLKTYYGLNLHPGSLVFVEQRKVARIIMDHANYYISAKLMQTCGGCGERLYLEEPEHRNLPSGWLFSKCKKCTKHDRESRNQNEQMQKVQDRR